jgi:hypothetical protein
MAQESRAHGLGRTAAAQGWCAPLDHVASWAERAFNAYGLEQITLLMDDTSPRCTTQRRHRADPDLGCSVRHSPRGR